MCGRFSHTATPEMIARQFARTDPPEDVPGKNSSIGLPSGKGEFLSDSETGVKSAFIVW